MNEEVIRQGRLITVKRGAVSITHSYKREDDAQRAERRLLAEKAARTRFHARRGR